jgi:hypothetical protein
MHQSDDCARSDHLQLIQVERERLWNDQEFPVIVLQGRRYVLGTHVASMLSQATYNLYSAARKHGIQVVKVKPVVLKQLHEFRLAHPKAASMFEVAPAWDFVESCLRKKQAKRQRQLDEGQGLRFAGKRSKKFQNDASDCKEEERRVTF